MGLPIIIILLFAGAGCEAAFTDLRPPEDTAGTAEDPPDSGSATAADVAVDEPDAAAPGGGGDAADGETSDVSSTSERVVAEGMFEPRADYGGEGTAQLVRLPDDSWELRLGEDFSIGSVPGPVVVLARENSLGSTLEPARGDMELGVLESNEGASSYRLPEPPGDRRIAWIYCKPFGLQMASAQLVDR